MARSSELPTAVVRELRRHGIQGRAIWAPKGRQDQDGMPNPCSGAAIDASTVFKRSELVALGAYLALIRMTLGSSGLVAAAAATSELGMNAEAIGEIAAIIEREVRRSSWSRKAG